MPRYEYECDNPVCPSGGSFEVTQSIHDSTLTACPHCSGSVSRVISPVGLTTPSGDARLKDLGFTKLVRRDKGVYENVTRRDHEARYFRSDKPGTRPDLTRRNLD